MSDLRNAHDDMYVRIIQGGHDLSPADLDNDALVSEANTSQLSGYSFSWGFGPLSITGELSPASGTITVKVALAGIQIANLTIDAANPKACVKADVKLASAKLCIGVDFSDKSVSVEGEVCAFLAGCKSFDQVIFRW